MQKFMLDKSVSTDHAFLDLSNRNESQNNILKKFKFLRSIKSYIFSKIYSYKYELAGDAQQEISIISYDQHSFSDVEDEMNNAPKTIKIDEKVLYALKQVLSSRLSDSTLRSGSDLELLETVEKTFARQLDIFEGMIRLINLKNNNSDIIQQLKKHLKTNSVDTKDSTDEFINEIIQNLMVDVLKITPKSEPSSRLLQNTLSKREENLGDNKKIKTSNINCECQQPTASGAAVPKMNFADN